MPRIDLMDELRLGDGGVVSSALGVEGRSKRALVYAAMNLFQGQGRALDSPNTKVRGEF